MYTLNFSFPNICILFITTALIWFVTVVLKKDSSDNGQEGGDFFKGFIFYLGGILIFSIFCIAGAFSDPLAVPPRFPLFFIFNFIFMFLLLFQKNKNRTSLSGISSHWLIHAQAFRVLLEIVVFLLFVEGITPKEITFQGQSFDLIVGLAALPIGYVVKKGYWKAGIVFNVFGLLSLVNIIFIAIFSFPTPFRIFNINYLPTYFPGILIPLFIAPMAIFFHVLSLVQLLNKGTRIAKQNKMANIGY